MQNSSDDADAEPDTVARQDATRTAEKGLTPAAQRALDEAASRRAEVDRRTEAVLGTPEQNGRGGLDPVRYEDWEIGGRAIDF